MELRDVRAFAAIVELGGMTRAARRLHVVQSTMSQAVKRLENEIGIELLTRSRNGVEPTPAGEEFARHADRILQDVARLELEMASYRNSTKGVVNLGTATVLSPVVLTSLIRRIDAELPGVELRVCEGISKHNLEALRLGKLDLLLLVLPVDSENLQIVITGMLELFFILAPSHPLASKPEINWSMLEGESWVSFGPTNPSRCWLEDNCSRAGLRPHVTAEVETVTQLKAFVEAGHGIALLPREVIALELMAKRLAAVRLAGERPYVEYGYAYKGDRELRPAASLVQAIVESELRQMGSRYM